MFQKLRDFFNCLMRCPPQQPNLKNEYLVSDATQMLAKLTLHESDMFWHLFKLIPLTSDEALLARLYSEEFWHGDLIVITEAESGHAVEFFAAVHTEETEDDIVVIDYWKDRPVVVNLRGPYTPSTKAQGKQS